VAQSVLAYERTSNWALKIESEDAFIEAILEGQPEPPRYFAQMKYLNKFGPPLLTSTHLPRLKASRLDDLLEQKQWVVDTRGEAAYALGHAPGSLFLPNGNAFVNWAGWILPYDQPIYLISDRPGYFLKALQSIGLDRVEGYFPPEDVLTLAQPSQRLEATEYASADCALIDVRSQKEWDAGHMPGAEHRFLGNLLAELESLPAQPTFYCGSGLRSLIASSLAERAGKSPRDVRGGFAALQKVLQPV
jgi:hydroxyacylglutathione hydrolase